MNRYTFSVSISAPPETFAEINEESKLRVTLSDLACSVIESDKLAFSYKSSAAILNGIFEKMYRCCCIYEETDDDVFAYHAYMRQYAYLTELTKKEDVLNKHLLKLQDSLSAYLNLLRGGEGKNHSLIVLSKNNRELLSACTEATVYGAYRAGLFFRCVIEAYARKPYLERERIMVSENVRLVLAAIQNRRILKLTSGNTIFRVKPYRIMQNPLATYSYLVCLSKTEAPDSEYKPASFRISRISGVAYLQQDAFISKEAEKQLNEAIRTRGVQYLLGEPTEIEVLLTPQGVSLYRTLITVRPPAAEQELLPDGCVRMRFCCTLKQASDYFFAFGRDAEILSPLELRQSIAERYKQALNIYAADQT